MPGENGFATLATSKFPQSVVMKKTPIDRPISFLPIFSNMIHEDISHCQEQYDTLYMAKDKPSVLTDEIINRIIALHKEKEEFIENYARQFNIWKRGSLSADQAKTISSLEKKLPQLQEINQKVLNLAHQMAPYTIDKVLAMDSAQLSSLHLSGQLKPSSPLTTQKRFLVITDQGCEAENLQLSFFFKERGSDLEVYASLGIFFEDLLGRYDDLTGWGAKRLIGFFKNFNDFEGFSHIMGAMAFTQQKLETEAKKLKMTSFIRLWCDRFDEEGFPVIEVVEIGG